MESDHEYDLAIHKSINILAASFRVDGDESMFEAYSIGLQGCSVEQVKRAVAMVIQGDFQFMPSPGKLRLIALTGVASIESRADIAWHEFDRAVGRYGSDRSVSFDDGIINATVHTLGGWNYCCDKVGDDYFVWLQKEFKAVYGRLCARGRLSAELLAPLTGRMAIANSSYSAERLAEFKAYTGQLIFVETTQPVLMPPSNPLPNRIASRGGEPKRLSEIIDQ